MFKKDDLDPNFNRVLLQEKADKSQGIFLEISKWSREAVNKIAFGALAEADKGFYSMEIDLKKMYLDTKNSKNYFSFSEREFSGFASLVILALEDKRIGLSTSLGTYILTISWR
jgi:hypothetical protein